MTEVEKAKRSADKDFILKVADKKYEKKKWNDALALYERLDKLVAGTDDAPHVVFNSAYANYYSKSYKLAGHQFKQFSINFPSDPRKEEAAYMSALCYYKDSYDYNLDQSSTDLAINELQSFLDNYPDSERSKNINELIDELSYKLEFKAYENARQYYKMANYKSASIAFENVLDDFPSTKLRPKIYDFILKSRYELALNSVFDLKRERIDEALSFTRQVERELPDSEYSKTAADLRDKLVKEKENFAKAEAEMEIRKAELLKKQRALEADEQNRLERDVLKNSQKARRDSAATSTPPPTINFNIRK